MARKRDDHTPRDKGPGDEGAHPKRGARTKARSDKALKGAAAPSAAGAGPAFAPTGKPALSEQVTLNDFGPVSRVGAAMGTGPVLPAAVDALHPADAAKPPAAPLAGTRPARASGRNRAAAGNAPARRAAMPAPPPASPDAGENERAHTAAKSRRTSGRSAGAVPSAAPDLPPADPPQPDLPQPQLAPPAQTAPQPPVGGQPALQSPPSTGEAARADDANPMTVAELPARLAENIERIEALSQRLIRAVGSRPVHAPAVEGPGPQLYNSVAQAWLKLATAQPARLIEQQVRFWGDTLRHVSVAQQAFARNLSAPETDAPQDRRFQNPLWRTNPFYHFVMTQYQINADAIRKAAAELDVPDDIDRRRIDWFTRQMIDMLAPTNFLATNPDALERAIETEGESLVRGLENLVRDIETNGGDLVVSLSDRAAFRVGENIATTPGEVILRTPMLELIQFHPTTAEVRQTPIVVFPPWINKYYIMDLKPQNSLLRWIVDQGHTLFVVSWKNPGKDQADLTMDDYVASYLEVIDKVLELTGEPQVNAVGYCIAGTTLSAALGLMKQTGDDRVKSATFFTTLTDFSDQGEFTTFLQDDFVGGIEDEVAQTGYLSAQLMQRTFSFLRANDLIWGPAIRSYMLGEAPPAFDLLYWNGDGTNLPGRMVTQYLRQLCQKNALVEEGFEVLGHRVKLSEVTVPLCAVACEGDHIAPWMHSWNGVARMGAADKSFILSQSGHIAGIINPPSKMKYGHYTSDAGFAGSAQDWRAAGEFQPGSWWGRWGEWLAGRSGGLTAPRIPAGSLAPAPGTYVLERS